MTPELKSIATRIREFISRHSTYSASVLPTRLSADEFNTLALELFALQFAHNAAYRRICESRTVTPVSVGHWTGIPAVPTAAFKELELTCIEPAERIAVFHSSGTTGQRPSRHFHSPESLALYEASLWPWFQYNVLANVGQGCLAMLTPPPASAPNSSLVHMFQTIRGQCRIGNAAYLGDVDAAGGWTLDFAQIEACIRNSIAQRQPLVFLGTAFNFVHLLDELSARDLRFELPPGSVVMETGGYKGRSRELPKAELHALITRLLGVPRAQIICEYGMSELSSQAYDHVGSRNTQPVTRTFRFPPWARLQIISPETGREVLEGETGLVRIFDLANVFSVLAVQTEDLAVSHGDGFELLGRAAVAEARGCSLMTA